MELLNLKIGFAGKMLSPELPYIELKTRCESQMQLAVCSGCDACGLRCTAGVPATKAEWQAIRNFVGIQTPEQQAEIARVTAQDKTVSLGDDVTVTLCRYRNMAKGGCMVYPARPLICRLLGHVEWMPCPIEKVPTRIATPDALALMLSYAKQERRTFEEWEADEQHIPFSPANPDERP